MCMSQDGGAGQIVDSGWATTTKPLWIYRAARDLFTHANGATQIYVASHCCYRLAKYHDKQAFSIHKIHLRRHILTRKRLTKGAIRIHRSRILTTLIVLCFKKWLVVAHPIVYCTFGAILCQGCAFGTASASSGKCEVEARLPYIQHYHRVCIAIIVVIIIRCLFGSRHRFPWLCP